MPRPPKNSPDNSRAGRLAAVQRQAKAKRRREVSVIWVALGLVLALLAGLIIWAISTRSVLTGVESYQVVNNAHQDNFQIDYEMSPPVGGYHHSTPLNCGVYADPVPAHHAVHSLEHGAVWLSYEPGIPADQLAELERLADQPYILLSPYPGQGAPVKATAWGLQLSLDEFDSDQLRLFIREYRQGPQTPEPGAACAGTSVDLVPASAPSIPGDTVTPAPGDNTDSTATSSPGDDSDSTSGPGEGEQTTSAP